MSPSGHAYGKWQKINQQTDTLAKRKISKRKTVRQQTDQRRTANSSKHLKISKQQQNFRDQ
jgi:hypothetical protein